MREACGKTGVDPQTQGLVPFALQTIEQFHKVDRLPDPFGCFQPSQRGVPALPDALIPQRTSHFVTQMHRGQGIEIMRLCSCWAVKLWRTTMLVGGLAVDTSKGSSK